MEPNVGQKLCIPFQFQIQVSGYDLSVKYLEHHNQTCVEFTHTHLNFEIYYILEGSMRMHIGGAEHTLLPGHFILIPPGVSHGAVYDPGEPKEYVVFVFGLHKNAETLTGRHSPEQAFAQRLEKALGGRPYLLAMDKNGCGDLLSEIERESQECQLGWQMVLADCCRSYLIRLLRNVVNSDGTIADGTPASAVKQGRTPADEKSFRTPAESETAATPAAVPGAIQTNLAVEITKYMHQHYSENISLEDISKAFHITPRHVTRLFSDYFGTSFRKTLSIYRLNYAKNYLLSTDKSVEEVAELVGISAVQTLYRLFKENEGMTISEYRSRHRRRDDARS